MQLSRAWDEKPLGGQYHQGQEDALANREDSRNRLAREAHQGFGARVSDTTCYFALPGAPDPTNRPCIALSTVSPAVSRNAADCPPFASFLCTFPDHPKHARQASYFSEPPSPSSRLLYFTQIFLLPVLRCVVLRPCLAYLLSSSLSSLSYTKPIITVIFEQSATCKRGRTVHGSLPLPEPPDLDFLIDCCSCQHPRPCEHVRGARMRSNPVSTQVEPMKSVVH